MKQEEEKAIGVPENAFRELKPGEVYNPLMSPDKKYPEVNLWSVLWGIAMAVLFSAAAAYLGLKVGQVFEAAIPIAIIAVGVSGAAKRKNALGENVIIQSIGASSGVIVAGAIFTLPALYILQESYPQEITVTFAQVFISSLLGGVLGILFLIPFRKYFVSDMHGKYPFPEATATTQVLVSGEKGGSQAKPLLMAGIIGGLYDFIVATFGWWNENFTTRVCGFGEMLAEKAKLVFKVNTGAAVLGLGYIVGLKYASIICAGSLAVWWIIIPGMSLIWGDSVLNQWNPEITATVGAMSPEEIFKYYAKSIGIGGIAMAGIIGIIKSWGIIKSAVGLAAKEMGGKADAETNVKRNATRPFHEDYRYRFYRDADTGYAVLLLRCDAGQPDAHGSGYPARCGHLVPLHHRSSQCHCHCGNQSGIGHDADDAYPCIGSNGGGRPERSRRNGGSAGYGRCGLYGTVHGGRFHHRP